MKDKVDYRVLIAAIAALVIIEIYALSQGVNGKVLAMVLAIIAGIAGWTAPQLKIK